MVIGFHKWLVVTVCNLILVSLMLGVDSLHADTQREYESQYSSKRYAISVPASVAVEALGKLAEQTETEFLFPYSIAETRRTQAVVGRYTVMEALSLMLVRSGLSSGLSKKGVITIFLSNSTQNNQEREKMMNSKKKLLAVAVAGFLAGGGGTSGVSAQEVLDGEKGSTWAMEEIVVTATRRATNLNDTAVSIAAIGGDDVDRRNLSVMNDYLRTIPGVTYVDMGVGSNTIVVRGLTIDPEAEQLRSGPTVGLYLGEVSIGGLSNLGSADLKMIDLERVEVLRGPQGTLFGSGSLAGAVRNIPNAPNFESFEGSIRSGYSNTAEFGGDNTKLEGVINIPLIEDALAIRAVGYRHKTSGYIKNIAGTQLAIGGAVSSAYTIDQAITQYGGSNLYKNRDDIGESIYEGVRFSGLWEPTDQLSVTLSYIHQNVEQTGQPYTQLNTGGFTQVVLDGGVAGKDERLEDDISIINLVAEYDLGWGHVLSSTARSKDDSVNSYDLAPFALGSPSYQTVTAQQDVLTQELRFISAFEGNLQFVGGVYFEKTDSNVRPLTYATGDVDNGDLAKNIFGTPLGSENHLVDIGKLIGEIDQLSFYGEFSYEFSDEVELTVGARRFDYERTLDDSSIGAFARDDYNEFEETGTTGKINLSYEPVEGALFYLQFSEGFRLGNVNNIPPASLCDVNNDGVLDGTSAPLSPGFESDTTENFELGSKLSLHDKRLQINTSIYQVDWQDIPLTVQGGQLDSQTPQTCFFFTVYNAAKATSKGFEVEVQYQLSENIYINLGGGYTRVELAEDSDSLNAKDGDRLPGVPEYSVNLGLQYDFELAAYPSYIKGDYAYVSDFYNGLGESGTRGGGYGQLNVNLGLEVGKTTVNFFAHNLTNEDDLILAGLVSDTRAWRLRPRTVGLMVGYNF